MKTKFLLVALLASALPWLTAKATETEPNNTKATANTLALNGSNTGAIGAADEDWWSVTTTGDGKLDVTITISNALNMWCQIYDNDGVIVLNSGFTASTTTITNDGLAAGTYYMRVYPYTGGQLPAYTISNTLTPPAQANDSEPNDTKASAKTLPLNGSKTGHVNYYYNNKKDTFDWYKVTTNADGRLRLTMSSANGQNVWAYLYDNDGTTLLGSGFTAGTNVVLVNLDGLAVGTYYIRVNTYYSTEYAPYTLADSLFTPVQPIDIEPNDTKAQALTMPLNGNVIGHINYFYNNKRDTFDWYKVTTNADGRLRLTMSSANAQNVWAYLYDNDGTTLLGSSYTAGTNVVLVNADGLAAGTYYIRVNTYYNSEWAPYTLADSLFSPTQPIDAEPNGTKAQALTLPLNKSKTGHINYYYNNKKDTFDWYKVTTNADGRLRLTMTSANGQNVWAYLYDHDGTTLLAGNYTTGSAAVVNLDGLAAGTYYIRVNTYYNSEWAPYTLADSLFTPTQANDTEPNDTKATALTLAPNSSTTGHTNYYYNLLKDGQDWYQLTTTQDGNINIAITSHNGQNVWAYLYDNDGTTVIGSAYSTSSTNYNVDGLAAGTYYIRINTYYASEFAPYTLANTFTPYNTNDAEPNNSPYQAPLITSNTTFTGHVNFYYNLLKDGADWHKINYTGAGAMALNINQEAHKSNGAIHNLWVYVYKDTLTAPVASQYSSAASWSMNLTGLTPGYYWIRTNTFYASEFVSYSLGNVYTELAPKFVNKGGDTGINCNPKNQLAYSVVKSPAPYTVQLYRYGVEYGSSFIQAGKKNFTIKDLPVGSYYFTGVAEGGNVIGTSKAVSLMPMPIGTSTTGITSTQAVANWTVLSCAKYYSVQFRVHGTLTWTKKKTTGNVGNYTITGLTPSTMYDWEVAAVDSLNSILATSRYTDSLVFTTGTAPFAFGGGANTQAGKLNSGNTNGSTDVSLYPNPAAAKFRVQWNMPGADKNINLALKDANGKTVWSSSNVNAITLKLGIDIDVSRLNNGIYMLQIVDANNNIISKKVIVSK